MSERRAGYDATVVVLGWLYECPVRLCAGKYPDNVAALGLRGMVYSLHSLLGCSPFD